MKTIKVGDLYSQVVDGKIESDIELQRAIVYDKKKQELVIDSILNGIPLPAFYFWQREDGVLEVLDGKQRIEAIKQFRQGEIKYREKTWKNYAKEPELQEKFNNVELTCIVCSGSDELKREIFRRINTLGVALSKYEVLNGLYHGEYLEELSDAFRDNPLLSKVFPNDGIDRGNNKYKLLEYIFSIRHYNHYPKKGELEDYVEANKDKSFEDDFNKVRPYLSFIKDVFHDQSKIKQDFKLKLAAYYYKDKTIWREKRDEIFKETNNYILNGEYKQSDTKYEDIEGIILGIIKNRRVDPRRFFSPEEKARLLVDMKQENGMYRCEKCNNLFNEEDLTVDHIEPWSKGGRTDLNNARIVCRSCNSSKGNREE